MNLLELYNTLLKEFKEQGWWPRFVNGKFVYDKNNKNKLNSMQRFIVIVSAILTQNTSWKNTEKAIKSLDKFNFLNKEAIKQLKEGELAELIKSSGYYKQKAKKLKAILEFLDSGKEITKENLLKVWGVGKETADSILLYAFNEPVFVIDSYTKRIMERLKFKFKDYDELQKKFMEELPKDYKLYNEFHALLIKLGKEYCKKKPRCEECCLRNSCNFSIFYN